MADRFRRYPAPREGAPPVIRASGPIAPAPALMTGWAFAMAFKSAGAPAGDTP